jgi:hypothetical protein
MTNDQRQSLREQQQRNGAFVNRYLWDSLGSWWLQLILNQELWEITGNQT